VAPWEGSMTRLGGVCTWVRGEVAPGRGMGGDDASWTDTNLTGLKNEKKIHTVDSIATNGR
jgi:hypothetical protein